MEIEQWRYMISCNSILTFGTTCAGCIEDLNSNGAVDIQDFLMFNSAYGTSCE